MVPDVGTRLTWHRRLGKEGSVPRAPGAPNLCHPSPGVTAEGWGCLGRWVSLRPRSLTPLQENALGKRRLLRLGTQRVCEPGAEHGCSRLAPNNVKMPLPWGKSRWQLASEEGPRHVPSTSHLLPGKGSSRPPTHCSAGTVRHHPSLCQASQAVSGMTASSSPLRRGTRDPL